MSEFGKWRHQKPRIDKSITKYRGRREIGSKVDREIGIGGLGFVKGLFTWKTRVMGAYGW